MPRRQWTGHLLVLVNVILAAAIAVVVLALVTQKIAPATRGIAPPVAVVPTIPVPPTSQPHTTEATPPAPAIPSTASVDAYRGLASWVDIYDTRAWRDPAAAVSDMGRNLSPWANARAMFTRWR